MFKSSLPWLRVGDFDVQLVDTVSKISTATANIPTENNKRLIAVCACDPKLDANIYEFKK